jgi:hypothetical protein
VRGWLWTASGILQSKSQKLGDATFLRCMRELGLNLAPPGDVGRPPLSLGEDKDVPAAEALLPESKQTLLF